MCLQAVEQNNASLLADIDPMLVSVHIHTRKKKLKNFTFWFMLLNLKNLTICIQYCKILYVDVWMGLLYLVEFSFCILRLV